MAPAGRGEVVEDGRTVEAVVGVADARGVEVEEVEDAEDAEASGWPAVGIVFIGEEAASLSLRGYEL